VPKRKRNKLINMKEERKEMKKKAAVMIQTPIQIIRLLDPALMIQVVKVTIVISKTKIQIGS